MPFLDNKYWQIYKLIVLSFVFLLFIPFPQQPQFNNVNETLCIEAMWNKGDIISLVIQSALKDASGENILISVLKMKSGFMR